MPTLQINDLSLYYEQFGVGEPLIFLHSAYSRGILAFACQMLDFQQKYICYFPDFRGHGRSVSPSLEWSTPQLAEDILAMMDQFQIRRAHIVGYSLGGGVALHLAALSPERVRTLVTIGTGANANPKGADDFEPDQFLKNGQADMINQMLARHAAAHHGDWQEFMRQSARDWRNYPRMDAESLSRIACPALFIAGEHDPFVSESDLQALSQQVKGSKYWVVPGGSHRPHMLHEEPILVNQTILDFIAANA